MQKKDISEAYNKKIKDFSSELKKLKKANRLTSYLRAILFIIAIVVLYYSSSMEYYVTIISLIFIISFFLVFVKKNIALKKAIRKIKNLIKINEDELIAINGGFNIFHEGKEYINFDHCFSYDLDIFGSGSLFQFLNRTSTIAGKNKLAENITNISLKKDTIEKRQVAIKELSYKIDWRQNFTATSLTIDRKYDEKINSKKDKTLNNLQTWADETIPFINKKFWKYVLYILPALTVSLLLLAILEVLPYSFTTLVALINLGIVGSYLKKTNLEQAKLGHNTKSLNKIKELINIVEFSDYKSDYLLELQGELTKQSAYGNLHKLNKTLNAFDLRLNMIAGILLNAFLLWDLQILKRLELQKKLLCENISKWFNVIGEFDALISLANYNYNNPKYVFPKISEEDFTFQIIEGGHPLIDDNKMVTNSFDIDGLQNISIITGANMAGKSTFLRTIGINMILASAGTVVCAKEMLFAPIQIYTSVRTNDSLHKNESYFYAELMRLKKIVDTLKSGKKLFVIIDEMLRGTNSKDKHNGSYELIKQLIKLNTAGLVATHDIQLGKLIEEYPKNISNKRFEVEIINDEVVFDYKLKDGISQNLNASFLMKKYGIIE